MHTRGRQPIGVNQPPSGGTAYPFVRPSDEIRNLFADFFLSFTPQQPHPENPLRVAWLAGFGTNSVPAIPGFPTPAHAYDLLVVDAYDEIVFDSTTADEFNTSVWDNRLLIIEWVGQAAICRCVIHTAWSAADVADGQTQTYDSFIVTANAELQAECWYEMPPHVTSITVGSTVIRNKAIVLADGYNTSVTDITQTSNLDLDLKLSPNQKPVVAGKRRVHRIELDATIGNGLGVFPGCVGQETELRTINRVAANSHANFTLDPEGCIRAKRPVSVISESPRQLSYAAFDLLPNDAVAAIRLQNDCRNCCDCEYFARTYQGIKRQWFLFRDVATLAEETRDVYADNRERWLAEKAAREVHGLRLRISMDGDAKLRWGAAFCNSSRCCLGNLRFYLIFLPYVNGSPYFPEEPMFMCGPAQLQGSPHCNGPVSVRPTLLPNTGTPTNAFIYASEYADPQSQTLLYGRLCFPDAKKFDQGAVKIRFWAGVWWENQIEPYVGYNCRSNPQTEIFSDVQTAWEAAGFPLPITVYGQTLGDLTIVERDNAFCRKCECD